MMRSGLASATYLVDDAFPRDGTHLGAELIRHNQRPGRRLELRF